MAKCQIHIFSSNWNNSVKCSSRSSNWNNSPLNLNSNNGARSRIQKIWVNFWLDI